MDASKLSDCFKVNLIHLKVFGIWPGQNWHRYYTYYLAFLLCVNLFIYNTLLVLNCVFTPRNIELMIREFTFLFTEVTVMGKVFMVLFKRKKLFTAFDILDCEEFKGNDERSKRMLQRHVSRYKKCWKMYTILGNFSYFSQVFLPIFMHFIFNTNIKLELPICKYNFLDDGVVQRYFAFWFIYQSVGMYIHMQYNVNIDSLISGLMYLAISQVKILNDDLKNFKFISIQTKISTRDHISKRNTFYKKLKHYELILRYCKLIQDIVGVTLFIQFGLGSIMICVVLCGLILPLTVETRMFMVTYLGAIVLEIFVPAWLGTQLSYKSSELISAAYCSEWLPRSKKFKRSLKLFMARANTNIVITGWRIFPLSLDTFTSILKTAYSFFTLVRNIQSREIN